MKNPGRRSRFKCRFLIWPTSPKALRRSSSCASSCTPVTSTIQPSIAAMNQTLLEFCLQKFQLNCNHIKGKRNTGKFKIQLLQLWNSQPQARLQQYIYKSLYPFLLDIRELKRNINTFPYLRKGNKLGPLVYQSWLCLICQATKEYR